MSERFVLHEYCFVARHSLNGCNMYMVKSVDFVPFRPFQGLFVSFVWIRSSSVVILSVEWEIFLVPDS